MAVFNQFCLSSYLAFRYVAKPGEEWIPGIGPDYPELSETSQQAVGSPEEIIETLKSIMAGIVNKDRVGVLLSGGIDSAIVASFLPRGAVAYTINFEAVTGVDEAKFAAKYASHNDLKHTVINVTWEDYLLYEPDLMKNKKAPLHPVEVALHKAALQARKDGISTLLVGNGADSTFGGMDKLLSKDWTFDEFVDRYTFIKPKEALKNPVDITEIYEPFRRGEMIDYVQFLKRVHGIGIIQAFNNAIHLAGLKIEEPFEKMKLRGELDIKKIRAGQPKYMLVEVFKTLYPGFDPRRKVPFARPMGEWLSDYPGPKSDVFLENLDMEKFSGEQKYLIRCLDRFLDILQREEICL